MKRKREDVSIHLTKKCNAILTLRVCNIYKKTVQRDGFIFIGGGGRSRNQHSSPTIKTHDFTRFLPIFGVFAWFFILS